MSALLNFRRNGTDGDGKQSIRDKGGELFSQMLGATCPNPTKPVGPK